jgi:hypothetical protein
MTEREDAAKLLSSLGDCREQTAYFWIENCTYDQINDAMRDCLSIFEDLSQAHKYLYDHLGEREEEWME